MADIEQRPVARPDVVEPLPLMTRLNEHGFRLVMLLDASVLLVIMYATMFVRFGWDWRTYPRSAYVVAFFIVTSVYMVTYYFGGLYEREPRLGGQAILPRVGVLSFWATLFVAVLLFATTDSGVRAIPTPRWNLAWLFVLGTLAVSANRWLARHNRRRLVGPPRVLLVGAPDEVNVAMEHLKREDERVIVVGEASSADGLFERAVELDATDVILLSSRWLDDVYPGVVREFAFRDIGILQRVSAKETLFGLQRVQQVGGMPFVALKEHTLPLSRVRFKRTLELLFLAATAPVVLPFLALLSLYQLAVAGRPILYWQLRVGRDGEAFRMVKFRTMVPEAEVGTGAVLAGRDDPRIIPACRWIRATRLDELPQLWNVLKGEMSLVGPRPERPELTAQFERLIPGYATRYEIAPGITGLAQVHGRYHTDPEYKLGYDLQYLVNWSPVLDLSILLRTAWVVLARRL